MAMLNLVQQYRNLIQSAVWQDEALIAPLTPAEQEWLLCSDSLTAKLKAQCQQFEVELLSQNWQQDLAKSESAVLPADQSYLIREVFLHGDRQRWVFARTVIPQQLCRQFPQLMQLGAKPLGEFLFEQQLGRSGLQWSKSKNLSARRSLFYVQTGGETNIAKPSLGLLVAELFLKDFGYLHE
ncbi:chorismate lyase [Pasteurellaceae bacterium USgator11]|nr:chorismate lyase [Pasteurellaceae bacterium USgator41]TNG93819.1 chorismate lyase [Pasteurellaceae bacterium UScroc12]TNG98514.1 chorismate lyase [Pasteurellaceae bacterium UScroc31]TNH01932.1 chorismate lyase [Pasteurellaceae bacterium USgator11]